MEVECNTDETPELFKAQLFALSGVQPSRQKVMLKGQTLKDDTWGAYKLKDKATLLMMGSAEALPEAPEKATVFMEDMTEDQLASALELPAGLNNLGNTCYLNATVQCLRSVPELRDALKNYDGNIQTALASAPADSITAALKDLYHQMDKTGEGIPPIILLQLLHIAFPQFAEKNEHGTYQQQDANECWVQMVRLLQQKLPGVKPTETEADSAVEGAIAAAAANKAGFMDQYFRVENEATLKCAEAPDEPASVSKEHAYQLSCFISTEVKYIHTGLKSRLQESIQKRSPSLERDAEYVKESKINRLPAYLTIQMVRFYYKEKEGINAKILKDVKFPLIMDTYDLCTPALQKKLEPMRNNFKIMEDKRVEAKSKLNARGDDKGASLQQANPEEDKGTLLPYDFSDDIGSNCSGYYELQAVLTHQGRSSSSGHYVSWVKRTKNEWIKFDDDQVYPVAEEEVLRLSGGGDWHCAYVLLYGPRRISQEDAEPEEEEKAETETTKETKTEKMDTQ